MAYVMENTNSNQLWYQTRIEEHFETKNLILITSIKLDYFHTVASNKLQCSTVQLFLTLISTADECRAQNVNETFKLTLFKWRPKPGALGISS